MESRLPAGPRDEFLDLALLTLLEENWSSHVAVALRRGSSATLDPCRLHALAVTWSFELTPPSGLARTPAEAFDELATRIRDEALQRLSFGAEAAH